jgi:hypothetical protein
MLRLYEYLFLGTCLILGDRIGGHRYTLAAGTLNVFALRFFEFLDSEIRATRIFSRLKHFVFAHFDSLRRTAFQLAAARIIHI